MGDSKYVELVDAELTGKETPKAVLISVATYPSMEKVNIWFPLKHIVVRDSGCIEISRWIQEKKNSEEKVLVESGEELCTL